MKKQTKREGMQRKVPMSDEDIYREQVRDEIIKPRSKHTGPAPLDVEGNDHAHEAEELERQGYTEYGLENPPYTNDESSPEEPDPKAPKQWKIA